MRSMTMTGPTRSAPRWTGESVGERLILMKLDPAAFVEGAAGVVKTAAGLYVVSGTYAGRTYAEREAGAQYGPWAPGDEDAYLVCWQVPISRNNDAGGVPRGVLVKENRLPDWESKPGPEKAAIRAAYQTYIAVN